MEDKFINKIHWSGLTNKGEWINLYDVKNNKYDNGEGRMKDNSRKAKINKHGYLYLEKGKRGMVKQYCCLNVDEVSCGDWCPHFYYNFDEGINKIYIHLCHREWYWISPENFEAEEGEK